MVIINTKKIKNFLKRLPWLIAEHTFHSLLLLFCIAILVTLLVFYRYALAPKEEIAQEESDTQFRQELFLNLLDTWEKREAALEEAGGKTPKDIFYTPVLTE